MIKAEQFILARVLKILDYKKIPILGCQSWYSLIYNYLHVKKSLA